MAGAGYEVAPAADKAPLDAFLLDVGADGSMAAVRSAAGHINDQGVVAVAVSGGDDKRYRPIPRIARAVRLFISPLLFGRALVRARRVTNILERSGLRAGRLATGDRSQSHGLGQEGWLARLRLPVGFIVKGSRQAEPSVLDAVVDRASTEAGIALTHRTTTVVLSGKLIVDVRDEAGRAYVLHAAAGPPKQGIERSNEAILAVAQHADDIVLARVLQPLAYGDAGPIRFALERHARGREPLRLSPKLWDECLEFVISLHRSGGHHPIDYDESGVDAQIDIVERIVGTHRSSTDHLRSELARRLNGLPSVRCHGDLWTENVLVHRGRLEAVIDWEWSRPHALPLLDLLDLSAHSGPWTLTRPPGPRFIHHTWPLALRGGDKHLLAYCKALSVPTDHDTLEALAVAYWLDRVTRYYTDPDEEIYGGRQWIAQNLEAPLETIAAAW